MYLNPNLQGDLVLATDITTKVVSVDDMKSHLRIDTSDEDTLLGLYIDAATEMAENFCNRHFLRHSYHLYFNEQTSEASLLFPDSVLDATKPVNWIDANGGAQSSTESYLNAHNNPSIAYLSSDFVSVTLKPNALNTFWFKFSTGMGSSATDIPEAIKQAIKLIVADMYYFREDRKRTFPMTSEILLQPYKCYY